MLKQLKQSLRLQPSKTYNSSGITTLCLSFCHSLTVGFLLPSLEILQHQSNDPGWINGSRRYLQHPHGGVGLKSLGEVQLVTDSLGRV